MTLSMRYSRPAGMRSRQRAGADAMMSRGWMDIVGMYILNSRSLLGCACRDNRRVGVRLRPRVGMR